MVVFKPNELKLLFSSASQNFTDIIRCFVTILIAAFIKVWLTAEQMITSKPEGAVFDSLFGTVENRNLQGFGMQMICKVIYLALGHSCLSDVDRRVEDMLQNIFVKRNCSLSWINSGANFQLTAASPQESRLVHEDADKGGCWKCPFLINFRSLSVLSRPWFVRQAQEIINV